MTLANSSSVKSSTLHRFFSLFSFCSLLLAGAGAGEGRHCFHAWCEQLSCEVSPDAMS
jgi:hypothetical protein